MKIGVALSGGTDSLASLMYLADSGHDLIPFHAVFFNEDDQARQAREDLSRICTAMGLSLKVLDLTREFENLVIQPFIQAYLAGLTPNPCAVCNRTIKFGLLFAEIKKLGAQLMATGHYAQIRKGSQGMELWKAADQSKDQSYFLSLIPVNILENIVFPLASLTKVQASESLRKRCISPPVSAESNEICFIPGNYRDFILSRIADPLCSAGPVKTRQGNIIGEHNGLWQYTQGQRKGLGIAYSHPLYVLAKDYEHNTLIVGSKDELLTRECSADQLNFHLPPVHWPEKIFAQTRYRQQTAMCTVQISRDIMTINFSSPQEIPAPGQVAAIYTEDGRVLGAGTIRQDFSRC